MRLRSDHTRGVLMALVGIFVLSPDALILRLVGTDRWSLIFWRGLLTALTLLVCFVAIYRRDVFKYLRAIGRYGLLGGFIFATSSILFVTSIVLTSVANTLVIISAAPLFTAISTGIFLHEPVPVRTWLAIFATLVGITTIFSGSLGGGTLLGDLCAIGTAIGIAGHLTIARRARTVNMVPTVAVGGLIAALAILPLATPTSIDAQGFLLMLLLGVVVLPISTALIVLATRFIPAAEVSLIMLLEAILGPLWVWAILSEVPTIQTFIGGTIVLSTLTLHSIASLRKQSQ
ncbi:MAG: DMT family transporter [Gammaproteobacteria bacterium]|nr:DMT family transporter [Gammaproteobacteria bacterium]